MRALVVSDVHANITALDAVLDASREYGFDQVWCAGDIVGYGPDPHEIIERLRALGARCVAGNHDLAACGLMSVDEFNPVAADAARWTAALLTHDERDWLGGLPAVTAPSEHATMAHGSLRAPAWEYLLSPEQAEAQFALQETPLSIVGHSHLPFHVRESGDSAYPLFVPAADGATVPLDTRTILNPGSVGQPRDGDARASFMLYDDVAATATWRRVSYDIAAVQQRILAAGLPPYLAHRLALGR